MAKGERFGLGIWKSCFRGKRFAWLVVFQSEALRFGMAEKEEALRCLAKGKCFPPGNQRLINNANGPIGALIVWVVPDGRVIPDKFPVHRLVKLAAVLG